MINHCAGHVEIFHPKYLFLQLITYRCQLIDLTLLWYFLRLLAMLILVQKENKENQANMFQETYSESC